MRLIPFALLLVASSLQAANAPATADSAALYQQHCQSCHGLERLGGAGPALLPESLSRLKPAEAHQVIRDGRPASQMAAYGALLDEAQIAGLVDYLYQPAAQPPTWQAADIRASQRLLVDPQTLKDTRNTAPIRSTCSSWSRPATIMCASSMATVSRNWRVSPRTLPCTAGQSFPPMAASSTSPRAMAGSACMTCTT